MSSVAVGKSPSGRPYVEFAFPTTPEIRESAFGRDLERNRTEDGTVKVSVTIGKHYLGILRGHESYLTPEDHQAMLELRALADEWAKQERRAWRALTFHQARTSKTQPAVEIRSTPRAREGKPSRATRRTAAAARSSPSSSSQDSEPPLAAPIRGVDVSGVDRIPLLPLGELHPGDRCYRCGASTVKVPLQHAQTLPTLAVGLVCDDPVACERRYYRLKHGITDSTAGRWAA